MAHDEGKTGGWGGSRARLRRRSKGLVGNGRWDCVCACEMFLSSVFICHLSDEHCFLGECFKLFHIQIYTWSYGVCKQND